MANEKVLNRQLLDWIFNMIEDMIKSTIEDTPNSISTFIAVNDMMNQLKIDITKENIGDLISEFLVNKIIDEIKSNM